jgi:hypothetical protein
VAQRLAEPLGAAGGLELARGHPGVSGERPLQVRRAEAGERRQIRQLHRLVGVRPQVGGGLGHRFGAVGDRTRAVRLAAQTRPEAGTFGVGGLAEEPHLVAARTPARAGRPAEDAGALHRIDEMPLGLGRPGEHLRPAGIVVQLRHGIGADGNG